MTKRRRSAVSAKRAPLRTRILSLGLAAALGCSSSAAPEAVGSWGGPVVSLTLARAGGALTYQCGTGTIDSTWTLDSDGRFIGTGQHYFGGGPAPSGGRPPRAARYAGRIDGNSLTLTVTLEGPAETLGRYALVRGGSEVRELCL